jgi:hypothetical protein
MKMPLPSWGPFVPLVCILWVFGWTPFFVSLIPILCFRSWLIRDLARRAAGEAERDRAPALAVRAIWAHRKRSGPWPGWAEDLCLRIIARETLRHAPRWN